MIRDLKNLYIATNKGKVAFWAVNLKSFIIKLNELEPESKGHVYYHRKFKDSKALKYESEQNEIYVLEHVWPE